MDHQGPVMYATRPSPSTKRRVSNVIDKVLTGVTVFMLAYTLLDAAIWFLGTFLALSLPGPLRN